MKIEIIQGHHGSRSYYQIERNELIIGSSNQCDLVFPNPEISRRHLSLLVRGDRYFVIDHNSTNGTFIEEERISPGTKVEWRTNTPMRLATGVILTLIEEVSAGDEAYQTPGRDNGRADQTRVIPLAELKAQVKKSPPIRKNKAKKKSGMGKAVLIVSAILALAYYLNVEKGIRIARKPKPVKLQKFHQNGP